MGSASAAIPIPLHFIPHAAEELSRAIDSIDDERKSDQLRTEQDRLLRVYARKQVGRFVPDENRAAALLELPRGLEAHSRALEEALQTFLRRQHGPYRALPDAPCPRCGSAEIQFSTTGRSFCASDGADISVWCCKNCRRWFNTDEHGDAHECPECGTIGKGKVPVPNLTRARPA